MASAHWGFYFYRVCFNTLDICLCWLLSRVQYGNLLEGSAPILNVLSIFNVSDVFGVCSEVVSNFFNRFCMIWRLSSVRSLWGSPFLLPGLLVYYRLSGGASLWKLLIVPKFSLILEFFRSSRKDCSAIESDVPGSLIPEFCSSCFETKKVSSGCFSSL